MLKCEQLACTAEPCLNFVENKRHIVLVTPGPQRLGIFYRHQFRLASLERLRHDTRYIIGCDVSRGQRSGEGVETLVLYFNTARKWNLNESWIFVNPLGSASCKLCTIRPAVKTTYIGHNHTLLRILTDAICLGQFDSNLCRFGASREQKNPVEIFRCKFHELHSEIRANLVREQIGHNRLGSVEMISQRLNNPRMVVPRIADEHT